MATNPISTPLPADLPENWETGQTVAPNGPDVGLAEQYGYNYQSAQINAAQEAINTIGEQFENLYGNSDVIPVSNGGTGATSNNLALSNIGAKTNDNILVNPMLKYNGRNQSSYNNACWTVDGWYASFSSGSVTTITDNGVQISVTGSNNNYRQPVKPLSPGTYTLSMLCTASGGWNIGFYSSSNVNFNTPVSGENQIFTITFTVDAETSADSRVYITSTSTTSEATLFAAKLEAGSVSTLATDLSRRNDESIEKLKLDMYDFDTGRPAYILTNNENLLDNGYFVGGGGNGSFPINQKGQSSYSGVSSGVDRWDINNSALSETLSQNYMTIANSQNAIAYLTQNITEANNNQQLAPFLGKNVTFSALFDTGLVTITQNINSISQFSASANFANGIIQFQISSSNQMQVIIGINASSQANLIAAKLEYGFRSTLARIENGQYIVNSTPVYSEELLKCQRYYQIYATSAERPNNGYDCRPVMRIANPTQGTIQIDSDTYYYNDASL